MNGAMAVPSVRTINVPNKSKKKTIGANQNFFRTFIKFQNSTRIDSLDINILLLYEIKIASHNLEIIHSSYYENSSRC